MSAIDVWAGDDLDLAAREMLPYSRLPGETDEQLRERLRAALKPPSLPDPVIFTYTPDLPVPSGRAQATTGVAKAGVNDSRKVECKKSKHHGFHPANEDCPLCDPPKPDWCYDEFGALKWRGQ